MACLPHGTLAEMLHDEFVRWLTMEACCSSPSLTWPTLTQCTSTRWPGSSTSTYRWVCQCVSYFIGLTDSPNLSLIVCLSVYDSEYSQHFFKTLFICFHCVCFYHLLLFRRVFVSVYWLVDLSVFLCICWCFSCLLFMTSFFFFRNIHSSCTIYIPHAFTISLSSLK